MDITERAAELDKEEPWIASIRLGRDFTKGKPSSRVLSTLAAKQALLFHCLERFIGPLASKRLLDIGSNQGYTSLEALMRGANVVALEPYKPNRDKTTLVLEANGFLGSRAQVVDDLMENITLDKFGHFDAVMFLGTIYHAEFPWKILRNLAEMTDTIIIESQVVPNAKVNDHAEGYAFRAFQEGPGTDLDDPKKNYLRQVQKVTVRVPTREALIAMARDAGFNLVLQIMPTETPSGKLSDLYWREAGILLVAQKVSIAPTLFDI